MINKILPEIVVIDVGARGGASSEWMRIGKAISLIGFEPDEKECDKLNNSKSKGKLKQIYYPYAIAGKEGIRNFYLTRRRTVSSLYKPIQAEWKKYGIIGSERNRRAEVERVVKVDAITLDDFCKIQKLKPDFLKLDTQGSELEILKSGFKKHIDSLIGLEIEVEFTPLYHGQALFSETEIFLRERGFELVGLKRHMWKMHDGKSINTKKGGRLSFADALFLHKRVLRTKLSKKESLKAALITQRYELLDLRDLILTNSSYPRENYEKVVQAVTLNNLQYTIRSVPRKIIKALTLSLKSKNKIVNFDEKYGF